MNKANELVVFYLAAWNETDPARRRALVARTWEPDGRYVDAHRAGTGHDGIDAMIGAAQAMFPGYRLRLASGIEAHGAHVRFSWQAGGSEAAPLLLGGTDFVTLGAVGRVAEVVGFVDAAPAM
jgi:hypothetical protein